jgi:hypothetical protein
LASLITLLPTVKVLFVEYDSRHARRALDRLLDETHELYGGKMLLDQGECIYLRGDLANLDQATEMLGELLAATVRRPGLRQ